MTEQTGLIDWNGEKRIATDFELRMREFSWYGILLCLAGIVTSPALLSIGTIVTILPAFAAVPLKEQLRRYWAHKPAFFLSLIFLLQLLSALWTRESAIEIWTTQIRVKAPLLFALYSLAVLGPFSVRHVRIALMVLLLSVVFVGSGTMVDYFLNKAEIDLRIQVSKEIQVWLGVNHIYFSIVSGFATLSAVWLTRFRKPIFFPRERQVIIGLAVMNFLIMHVLTTRTGLVGLYITAMVLGGIYVVQKRKFLIGGLALVMFVSLPFVGYKLVPSFKHRIDNTWMDVSTYFSGGDPNYLSIGTRLESWKMAVNIFRKHPFLGVGMADLNADMVDQYVEDETLLCPENFVLPHNQFLRNLAGFGLPGFLLLSIGWFWPVVFGMRRRNWLFWC
ncbi:MAG: O-antigen ligase family protein, partial [Bacteroidota bacterium]